MGKNPNMERQLDSQRRKSENSKQKRRNVG
jgi:hypothetical protein